LDRLLGFRYATSSCDELQATHGILAEILIDLDAAVFEIKLKPWPLVESVLAGFSQFARWQSMRSDLGIFAVSSSKGATLLC
jgi:hypothetical protein